MSNPLVFDDEEGEGFHHNNNGGGGYQHGHQQQHQPLQQQPYSAGFGFAATSWQLRKNLADVFNQQASSSDDDNSKLSASSTAMQQQQAPKPAAAKTSIFHKIAHFEQASSEQRAAASANNTTNTNVNARSVFHFPAHHNNSSKATAVFGKPPRQPTTSMASLMSQNVNSNHSGESNATVKEAKTDTHVADEKRCVSVYLRVRPPKEGMVNTIEILPGEPATRVRTHAPQRSNAAKMNRDPSNHYSSNNSTDQADATVVREFDFQRVFGPQRDTGDLYNSVVAPMVGRMFPKQKRGQTQAQDPKSGLLFAYGATNAGKTYSILGKLPSVQRDGMPQTGAMDKMDQRHHGIVPRAFQDILDHMAKAAVTDPDQTLELYLSYFEIYNENIYDLLDDIDSNNSHPMFMREPLKLRESHKQTFIRGLTKQKITSVEEGIKYTREANSKRHTSSNNINSGSSRSHCICQLQVARRPTTNVKLNDGVSTGATNSNNGYNTDEEVSQLSRQKPTTLWVVDLAGSERSKRTNVGTMRMKEGSLINKSLMNLMRCLSIMRDNQSSTINQVIPFRENKLTHLFMPVFTGRSPSSISMIVNVNPCAPDFDETNHVLSYASKAKMVQIEEKATTGRDIRPQTGEYGYNGRPIKKTKSTTSKIASLVKRLSPKKLMSRSANIETAKNRADESNADRKRKAGPPLRALSFNSTSNASTGNQNTAPKTKRMRVIQPSSQHAMKRSNSSTSLTSSEHELKSLKMALSIAHAELEVLKSERARRAEEHEQELEQLENNIRQEVSEEMEQQLENTKRHYTNIINQMKAQSRQSVGVFEKRAREEKAAEQIDVLLFKVEECEEEMKRQEISHRQELAALDEQHTEELRTRQRELKRLKAQLDKSNRAVAVPQCDGIVEEQRAKIEKQDEEIAALKKSKTDLIASYESLLADDDEDAEEEDEDEESDDDESTENNDDNERSSHAPQRSFKKQSVPKNRMTTRNRVIKGAGKRNTKTRERRTPLSSISENAH